MQAYHYFRPLLSPAKAWTAFRWQPVPVADDLAALTAMASACEPLARTFPILFPCAPGWLADGAFHRLLGVLGDGRAIPCLPAAAAADPAAETACRQLRGKGQPVAIEVADGDALRKLQPASYDHLLLDARSARNGLPLIDLINAHQAGFTLVAAGTVTHELFDWACAKRFALTSGEFIALTDPRHPVDADTTRLKLLKLLSLVVQDADTREIEEIFRQEPKLSYNLLRLVNSVAVGPRTPITGFNQAITVLGRRQLQRWLQLLIYANQFTQGNLPNPLLQLAAARGRQMELLVATQPADPALDDAGEAAFMVGIFSLLDTLLHMPMREVLASLPVAPPIADALGERGGLLGRLLTAVTAADAGDFEVAGAILDGLGVPARTHVDAQIAAYFWASRINLE
ncbi:EAL and HDOD domain-containing protein [Azospira restricta]|uniref:HDOD domain-containing protein n=1 Tax=Azospira restricta TaxID=404405 RepID=A0A974SN81_9RHOO|nr:HDOD domain-containing protein [Azospira restricta]QRJ63024.1 HDOD domain-containing protein [Azospira restricta]